MRVSGIVAGVIMCAPLFFMVCVDSSVEGEKQLTELRRRMSQTPPIEEIEGKLENLASSDELDSFSWYSVWGGELSSRIDDFFSALEQRHLKPTKDAQSPDLPGVVEENHEEFTIAMIGDSTMRMQADLFSSLLASRKTNDGRSQCQCTESPRAACECLRSGDQGEGTVGLRMQYYKVWDACVDSTLSADFVYFGCGLHILQLHPERKIFREYLDSWVYYEYILEESVLAYRSKGKERRGYLGQAFMSTHSFSTEHVEGPMLDLMGKYSIRNASVLASCYDKVDGIKLINHGWESEFPAKEICTRGTFTEEGVINLNYRAEAVMARLEVPVVPSYEITRGQTWATPLTDGRHYPALVPEELTHFLGKMNLALTRERLLDAPSTT